MMKLPPICLGPGWEDALDDAEVRDWVRTELDLIREGQDGTQHFTQCDIAVIVRWLKSYR